MKSGIASSKIKQNGVKLQFTFQKSDAYPKEKIIIQSQDRSN